MVNKNEFYYKMIKGFQEKSENNFIKNYDTDEVYYTLSRELIGVTQNNIDSSSHIELRELHHSAIIRYFQILERIA